MFSVAPNIVLAPNMTQNAERKHRTQDTNTAPIRPRLIGDFDGPFLAKLFLKRFCFCFGNALKWDLAVNVVDNVINNVHFCVI